MTDLDLPTASPAREHHEVLSGIEPDSLSERVFDAIRGAIVNRSFPPGTRLTEGGLARQLNVSKTPVREALLRLREIGLIEPDGRRGGRVVRQSRQILEHAYEIREALEVFSARVAAERASDDQVRAIAEAARLSLEGASAGDLETFSRWDTVFHTRVTDVAANPRLTELLDSSFALILALRTRDTPNRDISIECGHAHVSVATAIGARDARTAELRMRDHVRHVMGFVIEAMLEDVPGPTER